MTVNRASLLRTTIACSHTIVTIDANCHQLKMISVWCDRELLESLSVWTLSNQPDCNCSIETDGKTMNKPKKKTRHTINEESTFFYFGNWNHCFSASIQKWWYRTFAQKCRNEKKIEEEKKDGETAYSHTFQRNSRLGHLSIVGTQYAHKKANKQKNIANALSIAFICWFIELSAYICFMLVGIAVTTAVLGLFSLC